MLLDHIGKDYPNVLDFIEEVRQQGLSRRIQSNFEFQNLNRRVRYCAVHPRGYVHNEPWYRQYAQENPLKGDDGISREAGWYCPRGLHPIDHKEDFPCSGVWWHDISRGHGTPTNIERMVMVEKAEGPPFRALERPKEIVPIYDRAIVLVLPVVNLVVIKGPEGEHVDPLKKAQNVGEGIRVKLEDE